MVSTRNRVYRACDILSIISVLVTSLIATTFPGVGLGQVSSGGQLPLPTYYIYHGQPVDLILDSTRLAVFCSAQTTSANRSQAAAKAGLSVTSEVPTGISGWTLLNLGSRLLGPNEADLRIRSLVASSDVGSASPVFRTGDGGWIIIQPVVLVELKNGSQSGGDALLASIAPELTIATRELGGMPGAFKLTSTFRNGFDVLAIANRLAQDPRVEWAEPDMIFTGRGDLIPNDPGFADLWGIRNTGQFGGVPGMDMDGDLAWDITTGDPGVKVLILDVGVQQDHPDINQLPGVDVTGEAGNGGPVNDCDNHGTAVAGCVSAIINNALGTVGIAPGCRVLSARTFVSTIPCDGTWGSSASMTVDALAWGLAQGARVSNNSNYYGFTSSAIEAEYASTYAAGMVHFASAGNFASSTISYPASIPVVNSVAALTPQGNRASFSNYGVGLDFSAPGTTVYSTDRTGALGYSFGDYEYVDGTSFASPYAAGVAALIISQYPLLTSTEIEERMRCTSRDLGAPGYGTDFGWGFVNAYNAIISTGVGTSLSVQSVDPASGVLITVSPADTNSQGDGITPFVRTYSPGKQIALTAPSIGGGNSFVKWQRDGQDYSSGTSVSVTLDKCLAMTAVYLSCSKTVSRPRIAPAGPLCLNDTYAVTWNRLPGASSYEIQENGGSWVATGSDTSRLFSQVVGGTYSYVVRPVSACGSGASSPSASIKVNSTPPSVPTTPWFDQPSPVCVNSNYSLLWDTAAGAGWYEVRENGGSWTSVGSLSVFTTAKSGAGVYTYEVRGVNGCGPSGASQPASITITTDNYPPAPGQPLTLPPSPVCTGASVTIRWDPVIGAESYEIRENGGEWRSCGGANLWGVTPPGNGTYFYEVRSLNGCGSSVPSPAAELIVGPCYNLVVFSYHPESGVDIPISPSGQSMPPNTLTPYSCIYGQGAVVTLAAPATVNGWSFDKWQRDGVDHSTNPVVSLTIDANRVMSAVYQVPVVFIGSVNPTAGVGISVLPVDINDQADGITPFTRAFEVATEISLQAPAKANGHPFEKWQRDGADYPGGLAATLSVDTNHSMIALFRSIANIEIESKTAPAGSIPIQVKLWNDVPIRKIVLPLEIRQVTPGATLSKMRVTYAERLTGYLTGINSTLQYASPDGTCKNGFSGGYKTPTSLMTPDVDVTVTALPEGVSIVRGRVADQALPPGTDTTGSIILTVFVTGTHGSFEIDTTCTNPANHLVFSQEDPPTYTNIVPIFTKGTITIGFPNCACPMQGDTNGDLQIDVFDVIGIIGIAFSSDPDPQDPACPRTRGDVDNNGVTDVFDVIYLIATAFSGGPEPVDPCGP